MLDRVQQTLQKAGISNVIKGVKTYHTTPNHDNKTYETLLRYNNMRNEHGLPPRDYLAELMEPKSLLKCTNPLNQPHYLKKGANKIYDNFKFEPDPETSEKLC